MRCRLCGFEFDAEGMACHTECPLGPRCSLICCPNCGFQAVDEAKSGLARAVRRLWPSRRERPPGRDLGQGVPLSHVPTGARVEVEGLVGMSASRLSRLSAFGLAPGTAVRLVQRRPVPVVSVGETELALSEEILGQIRVHPPGDRT